MLRNPLPTKEQKNDYWRSWHIRNHPEIETINKIENFSGEIIMTDDPKGKIDPGLPPNIAGSYYYLSQRMLKDPDFANDWLNQVAYSYAIPHLAIRTKTGLQHPTPNTWRPWEFTVMSGIELLSSTSGNFKMSKNRNSDVVTLYIIKSISTTIGITLDTISNMLPKTDKSIPITVVSNGDFKTALLTVKINGSLMVESGEGPQGSFTILSQTVFYSIADIYK